MSALTIACEYHGVPGAAVMTTDTQVQEVIAIVKKSFSKKECRKMHKFLQKNLLKMLSDITIKGRAVSSDGEVYDRDTYNADLVYLAVYDHIGNDKKIALLSINQH